MLKFLTLKPDSFGLDISDLSLKIIKLKKKSGVFSLDSFGKESIKPGVIEGGEIKDQKTLVGIIKKVIDKVKIQSLATNYVVASLPEEKSFIQVIQVPKMGPEELKSAVRFEAENHIPLPLERVYLDFQEIEPLYDHLDHLDILVAAQPREIVDSYVSCLKEAGLQPLGLEIESQAIARALVKDEKAPRSVLLIDFGQTQTSFIIFSGCCVRFTSTIPISSQSFTQVISQVLKIDLIEAERMKIKYGISQKIAKRKEEKNKEEKIFRALSPLVTDLAEQIKKYLFYYQSHATHEHLAPDGKGVEKILLCGGGANLLGLTAFLSSELKLPVQLGNPWVNLGSLKKGQLSPKESLVYTTALGLALGGIKS